MKGKKIGILIIALMALSAFVLPASVSAGATYTHTNNPATVAWGQTEYISMAISGAYWNGTVWCNLTSPTGGIDHLGGVSVLLVTPAATLHYANWTIIPDEVGTWTVTYEFQRASGSGTFATHTSSFDQERTMIGVARDINAWSGVLLYLVVGVLLIALLLIMVSRVSDRTGKKGGV